MYKITLQGSGFYPELSFEPAEPASWSANQPTVLVAQGEDCLCLEPQGARELAVVLQAWLDSL